MERHQQPRGAARRTSSLATQLRAPALTLAVMAALWSSHANSQAGVEAAIATSGAATQARPLQLAGPVQPGGAAGAAAQRDAQIQTQTVRGPNCTGTVRERREVAVPVGKSTMIDMPEPVRSRTLGNPNVAQAMLVSPQTLYVLGQEVGSTNMIVQGRSGSCSVIDLTVGADPGGLQSALRELVPEARRVRVSSAADSLVLTGSVADAVQAQKILDIANAFVIRQTRGPAQAANGQATQAPQQQQQQTSMTQLTNPATAGMPVRSPRIINMMVVEAPQQVMLEVKVAEVSKTLIDQMGSAVNLQGAFGSWSFGLLANFLSSGASDLLSFSKANNLPLKFALDAQRGDGLVKILAEPNLMAISGQEASFLAGGKVFIPVPQSFGGNTTTIILQEETFGVGLRFTPTVMENGRINLKVAPEVSELSPTGVALTAPNVSGATILPLINTRRASTTLQVYDGQSFAIGGLIKNNITGSLKALPGVGELPVVGALMRSTNFQQDRTELLFVVTPRLVKPLPATYPLPTDSFGTVNRGEVYATGNMEGRPQPPAPMPGVQPAAMPNAAPATAPAAPAAPMPMPGSAPAPVTAIPVPAATALAAADAPAPAQQ
ncbi:type II and III secretion system protein family protein [Cupriavidus sp. SZY C1]|uniref:type II and III secretion system protein family protein n=1 Tax=Cupriavidus sp. SZY C1 TaxID=3055037 RepID=UPI0028B44355|nr:type II and III secretion system protein family protein [Cupriavidus sp. SZY C1]MDT6960808.1 type II and III secretion system protein family protein [Cupriavidus sp. SZY C1]